MNRVNIVIIIVCFIIIFTIGCFQGGVFMNHYHCTNIKCGITTQSNQDYPQLCDKCKKGQ